MIFPLITPPPIRYGALRYFATLRRLMPLLRHVCLAIDAADAGRDTRHALMIRLLPPPYAAAAAD